MAEPESGSALRKIAGFISGLALRPIMQILNTSEVLIVQQFIGRWHCVSTNPPFSNPSLSSPGP
jgi:hypothetical protein